VSIFIVIVVPFQALVNKPFNYVHSNSDIVKVQSKLDKIPKYISDKIPENRILDLTPLRAGAMWCDTPHFSLLLAAAKLSV
tara:strand:- start:585 stop:827 length:243 start_codon:yes stop_codon:yes gene_type:complete